MFFMALLIGYFYFQEIDTKEQSSAVKEGDTRFSEAEAPTDDKLQVASSDDIVVEPASDFLMSDASLDTETESSSSGTDTSRYVLELLF
jgi:hypothetical protein